MRLFGGGGEEKPAPAYDFVPSADAPQTISVTVGGSVMQMTREDYRTQLLLGQFKQVWNDPDRLAMLINSALQDEFVPDALEPARQLYRIYSHSHRSAIYLAAILIRLKQNDEAEKLLTDHIAQHGENGIVLTNLAKVQANKGDEALSERTLWRALELDPNQDNGFFWYLAIVNDNGGEAAQQEALKKLTGVPGSWRAQMFLARAALKAGDLNAGLTWYRQALQNARPARADMLMQMSGDLGNNGHLDRIVELCAAPFDAAEHGVMVGNNLIKAHIELGQYPEAQGVLSKLPALQRADWDETLTFWENELAQRTGGA